MKISKKQRMDLLGPMYLEVTLSLITWIVLCIILLVALAIWSYIFVTGVAKNKHRVKDKTATNINLNDFIPSTKEYQVFQKYYGTLSRLISTSPLILAADLYSAKLISEWTLTKVTSENSSCEMRTHYLLDELRGGVSIDNTNLMKIFSILQCHPPLLSAIAEKMKTECGKRH